MKAYFTQSDNTLQATRAGSLCLKMQQRLKSAQGNAALMNQLEREAVVLACGASTASTESAKLDRLDRTLALLRH